MADALCPALKRRGKNVWVDLTDIPPAADWRERVRQGIEASKAFVYVISPDAARSAECTRECQEAVQMHKRLVPVLYRAVEPEEIPRELRAPNWVPLDEGEQFERQLDTLVYALEADLDWRDAHARLAVRAHEWQLADRDRSYLLRGSDLREAQAWLADADRHREAPTELQSEYVEGSGHAAARRRRVAISGGLLVVAALAVLILVALAGQEKASKQSEIARSRQLAAAARERIGADPELSLLAGEGGRASKPDRGRRRGSQARAGAAAAGTHAHACRRHPRPRQRSPPTAATCCRSPRIAWRASGICAPGNSWRS